MDLQTFLNLLTYAYTSYWNPPPSIVLNPHNFPRYNDIAFDFIIVGGGSGGVALANRLSENPTWNILLIEAGLDEDLITDVPALADSFAGTKYDWNFTTTKQENVCQDTDGYCNIIQGRVMGGTSTIDDMMYGRGNRVDFDKWANELGNPGWGYDDVLPYFLKSENMRIRKYQSSRYHSVNGPQPVNWAPYRTSIVEELVDAAREFGFFKIDYNGRFQTGTSHAQFRMDGGRRWSSEKSFGIPFGRPNLIVFKNTTAIKIGINEIEKKATHVIVVADGEEYEVHANKEIILSAGAINTPKLLMLSGIGPKEHLEQLGIKVLANLPVGQYFTDKSGFMVYHDSTDEDINFSLDKFAAGIDDYVRYGKGILSSPRKQRVIYSDSTYYVNHREDVQPPNLIPDFFYNGGYVVPPLDKNRGSINVLGCYLTPESTGTIKLASTDYNVQPIIDPNYLSSDTDDLLHIRNGLQFVFDFHNDLLKDRFNFTFEIPPACVYNGKVTEEFTKCFMKYNGVVGRQTCSSARMGPIGDNKAVVNHELKVYGIKSLRIAGASIFPSTVRGSNYATVIMIAEKLADMIKAEYYYGRN